MKEKLAFQYYVLILATLLFSCCCANSPHTERDLHCMKVSHLHDVCISIAIFCLYSVRAKFSFKIYLTIFNFHLIRAGSVPASCRSDRCTLHVYFENSFLFTSFLASTLICSIPDKWTIICGSIYGPLCNQFLWIKSTRVPSTSQTK